jgi:penicillin-binding protein 1A
MAGPTRHTRSPGARPRPTRASLPPVPGPDGYPGGGGPAPGRSFPLPGGPPGPGRPGADPARRPKRPRPAGASGGRPPQGGGRGGGRGGNGGGGGRGRGGPGGRGPGGPGGGPPFGPDDPYDPGWDGPGGPRRSGGTSTDSRPKARKRSIIWRWRRPMFLIGLAMLAILTGVGVVFAQTELPAIEDLKQSSYICAGDVAAGQCTANNAMARLQDDVDRVNVPLSEVPPIVSQAVIAMEDRNFYEHDGINPTGIARAFYQNVKGGGVSQGGSTITQQYVKNAFKLSTERAISRKIKEAVLSVKLEQQLTKDQILEGYLNTIYFGRGAYGVGAAAEAYFGMDVRQIGASEAALLAGLIRAPVLAEPSKHPEEATRRRHTALVAMKEEGYITADEYTQLDAVPVAEPWIKPYSNVKLVDTLRGGSDADYIGTDYLPHYIKDELQKIDPVRYSDEVINGGGLRIYTSIDYAAQQAAWQAVTTTLDREDDPATPEWEGDPEASLVAVDDQGLIRAMVASRHRYTPEGDYQENYAVCGSGSKGREPGSTFKPIVLADAMRQSYSLKSRYNAEGTITFDDPKVVSQNGGKPWKVSNYSESDAGVLDLVGATRESSNTAYAQLIVDIGNEGPAQLAKQMGVGQCQDFDPHYAEVLGTVNATPLEMAGVYSTFANRGVYKKPDIITRVEQVDQEGKATVLYERQVQQTQVLSQTQADLVNYALQSVVGPGGTGESANLGKPMAGKTGTSQNNRNAWFAGFTPHLTAVVWMGYPNADYPDPDHEGQFLLWPMNRDGRLVHGKVATGGSFPAAIWKKFMEVATGDNADPLVEPTPQQINGGEILNKGELLTSDEAATTTTMPQNPGNPGPDPTLPGGGGGGPRPTLPTIPTTPSTTSPINTTTTATTPGRGTSGPG